MLPTSSTPRRSTDRVPPRARAQPQAAAARGRMILNVGAPLTYARSLRACALAQFNRPQDREVLAEDVDWLIHAASDGAYTYDDSFAPPWQKKVRKPVPATRATTRPRA